MVCQGPDYQSRDCHVEKSTNQRAKELGEEDDSGVVKSGQKQKMGGMEERKECQPENPPSMADHSLLKYQGTQVINWSHNSGSPQSQSPNSEWKMKQRNSKRKDVINVSSISRAIKESKGEPNVPQGNSYKKVATQDVSQFGFMSVKLHFWGVCRT